MDSLARRMHVQLVLSINFFYFVLLTSVRVGKILSKFSLRQARVTTPKFPFYRVPGGFSKLVKWTEIL
jgi:hypothetical protein